MLTDKEKWEAVIQRNPEYDGLFFYAARTTGIFCRPSCKSKDPLDKNAMFFDTATQAVENGFRPCKRCRPDLIDFKPDKDLAKQIKQVMDSFYAERDQLNIELRNMNVCHNHIIRIFRAEYHITPLVYVNSLRVKKAQTLLTATTRSVLDIAQSCGFGSLSSFYNCFKKQTGMSPSRYRKQRKEPDNDNQRKPPN